MPAEQLYLMREIAEASGVNIRTLHERRKRLGITANRRGYTLEQAKQIVRVPPQQTARYSKRRAAQLKQRLTLDGYL